MGSYRLQKSAFKPILPFDDWKGNAMIPIIVHRVAMGSRYVLLFMKSWPPKVFTSFVFEGRI